MSAPGQCSLTKGVVLCASCVSVLAAINNLVAVFVYPATAIKSFAFAQHPFEFIAVGHIKPFYQPFDVVTMLRSIGHSTFVMYRSAVVTC